MVQKVWSKFWKSSSQKRKQRKYVLRAPMHIKHKLMASHLSSELKKEYGVRSIPVRNGDTVTVLRGDSKGKSGKVTKVSLTRTRVFVEGVEVARADGTKALYPVHPSNLSITKLDLSDAKRKEKLEGMKNNKMASNLHLKRHAAPTAWPIKRKNITFIAKPNAGSHKMKYVTPLVVVLRDVLNYAETSKEVKLIVQSSEVLVNGKQVKDIKFPIGMFDVLELKKTAEKFVVLLDNFGKVKLVPQKDDLIYLKVVGKTQVAGGKFQLNFMNGFNILADEKIAKSVKVNDVVVYDFAKKKISSTLTLKEGTFVYFFDGKFRGQFGEVKEFIEYKGLAKDVVKVQIGKDVHNTAKDYAYVVGTKNTDLKRFE